MPRKKPETTAELSWYELEVNCTADLFCEWRGWRLRGRYLVSPHGDRISPERLAGLLFVESARLRLAKPGRQITRQDPVTLFRDRARARLVDAARA